MHRRGERGAWDAPVRAAALAGLLVTVSLGSAGIGPVAAGRADPLPAEVVSGTAAAAGLTVPVAPLQQRIGPPPAAGSEALARDLAILRWLQERRTPAGVARSWSLLGRDLSRFDAAVGASLRRSAPTVLRDLPAFLALFDGAKTRIKNKVGRRRPFLDHDDLRPCLPLERSLSYPSGHATWYWGAALLLADLLPERRERLLTVAEHAATARPTCGLHYPSDVEAGQRLAAAVAGIVLASPTWQSWKEGVAAEREALLIPPPAGLPPLGF
ncbi:phosphatase PAP2 family protein [Synechococcus sp. RSCCF101]|uniref:phosphatase PAP2 family protein n=1 Tax=Synechococcus sp. RSCCF101 TaxID=2511069 RepID=UPI001CDA22A4|nr:phosphatase PAP2 family protein [Synechococcus sp. RSCCF101]